MNLCKLSLSLALAVAAAAAVTPAQAQLSVYGTFTASRMSSIPYTFTETDSNGNPVTKTLNQSFNTFGGTGGVFYDFHTLGPVRLGVDARGTVSSSKKGIQPNYIGAGSHFNSALLGLRASFHTRFAPLHPYVEGAAGLARTDYGVLYLAGVANPTINPTTAIQTRSVLQYEGMAGLDVAVAPFMDIRVVELGFGGVHGGHEAERNFTLSGGNYPVMSVSSGIVFHLPF